MQVLQQQAQAAATVPMFPAPSAPVQQTTDLDVTELENLLCKIMESCTKESISVSHCHSEHPDVLHRLMQISGIILVMEILIFKCRPGYPAK